MDCAYHPGTPAAVTCRRCYRPVCRACVIEIPHAKYYCRACAQVPERASGLAISSFVVSIVGVVFCGVVSIVGMIMGIVENSRINRGESTEVGRGYAKAAIVIGALSFALGVFGLILYGIPFLLEAPQ